MSRALPLLALALGCAADPAPIEPVAGEPAVRGRCERDRGDAFVDCVDAIEPAAPASFGHDALPEVVLGPPTPATGAGGSLEVASLGCGGRITLGFAGPGIVDGDGDDVIVFENAFATADGSFAEPAAVLVSDDGETWFGFDCDADGAADGCAGVTPTAARDAHEATVVATAGGDAFDLAAVGLSHARWLRLVDRTREHWHGEMWCEGASAGFDLDAVAAVPR
ncbi:MAG: hypothetical protein U0168_05480 [Nannocystaceae bacterium]